jgi:hypothetical protein
MDLTYQGRQCPVLEHTNTHSMHAPSEANGRLSKVQELAMLDEIQIKQHIWWTKNVLDVHSYRILELVIIFPPFIQKRRKRN